MRTSDLQTCKETATSVDSTGQYQLKDLVNLTADKVGVIVRIEKERLHVLNMEGKVQIVPVQSVSKRKVHRNASASDSQNNHLNAGDIVNVIDGPFVVRRRTKCSSPSIVVAFRIDKGKSNISIDTSSSSLVAR